MQLSLHKATMDLLLRSKLSVMDIHRESGLPYFWLRKLYYGGIADPSVNKIQALYEFLAGKALEL